MENIEINELPLKLSTALAKNSYVKSFFTSLPKPRQEAIIEYTKSIESKQDVQEYVNSLIDW